jgi:hypothetical protein
MQTETYKLTTMDLYLIAIRNTGLGLSTREFGDPVLTAENAGLQPQLFNFSYLEKVNRLCGLVVRVLGYRSGGPGSIPGNTKKKSSGSGTGSTQPHEYN